MGEFELEVWLYILLLSYLNPTLRTVIVFLETEHFTSPGVCFTH